MYRDIIEDYSAIPRFLQQKYVQSLIAGANRGRIWRIVADANPLPATPNLDQLASVELVPYLAHANVWQRQTAQRLLVQRQDRSVAPLLEQTVREGVSPQSRLHALYTLAGLNALTPDTLTTALRDNHFAVVVHALQLADERLVEFPQLLAVMLQSVDHPHPRVRLQLALSLGASSSDRQRLMD